MLNPRRIYVLLAFLGFANAGGRAAEVNYVSEIKPILKARCYACHGALKQEAGLRLDTGESLRRGSENGKVVDSKSPNASPLIERVTSDDESFRMPPIGKGLAPEEVQLFRDWIAAGASSPMEEKPEADPREHWAFRVPQRPPRPDISNPKWARNEIDFFLHAVYDRHGLMPVPDATDAQILRRLYLDLIGLPPSSEQLAAFLNDPSDENYASIVEQLLNSPQYGERWGRHWMDVWRYSDWYGRRQVNDVRNSASQIWRWRDWIVNSLNDDKSYARMIQEMLAADELAAEDDSAWPATGYLIRNYYSLNPNEWMRHSVEYTGKAFLGLTFNCAHCHDHKYDPIAHDDYFRMRAFFEPMGVRQDRVVGEKDPPKFFAYTYGGSRAAIRVGMARIFDEQPGAETWFYTGGDERNKLKDRGSIPPGVPSFLGFGMPDVTPVNLPMSGWYPGARPNIQQYIIEDQQAKIVAAEYALKEANSKRVDTTELEARRAAAQQAFDQTLATAKQAGEVGALAGKQSLYLDADEGRRILQNTMPGLKAVPDGTTIGFQLRILKDSHVNFQLARDTSKHLTALYVAFVDGKIHSYQPGGFQQFTPGSYDFAAGQNHFDVRLVIQPSKDVVLLSVRARDTEQPLVQEQPIALNGWNPTKNPHQPFTFDCRAGTQVLVDDVTLTAGDQKFVWDFEEPEFADSEDVAGIKGWVVHPQSESPATSFVSMIATSESARASYEELKNAKAALRAATHGQSLAEAEVAVRRLTLDSLAAVITADNAIREQADQATIDQFSRAAYAKQLVADLGDAKWRIQDAQYKLQLAPTSVEEEKDKNARIERLTKQLNTAREDLAKANERQATTPQSTEYRLLSRTTSPQSTGRRSSLARWITDHRNPLTPRVAVNHIWLRHFHAPLVESVYDFGRNGKPPTHPKLLDWLAVELQDHEWSMKHIHRLIVTSRAYRMSCSTAGQEKNLATDEDNRLLWHMNTGRMEAEVVRDSILFVTGRLDQTMGGQELPNSQAMTTFRRSMYYEVYPEAGGANVLAEIFDPPDPTECFRRTTTVVPQQALALSNSELIHQSSVAVAKRISESSKPDDFIDASFVAVLSRHPSQRERAAAIRFLDKQKKSLDDDSKVRESLIRVLFNHNDFITIR